MPKIPQKFLFDVSKAIYRIEHFHLKHVDSLAEYDQNPTVQAAIERELGIIGEALYKLVKLDKGNSYPISVADSYINLRNTLIHQYDEFSSQRIWHIATKEIPQLKSEVDPLME